MACRRRGIHLGEQILGQPETVLKVDWLAAAEVAALSHWSSPPGSATTMPIAVSPT
jgi:hypothetical protein